MKVRNVLTICLIYGLILILLLSLPNQISFINEKEVSPRFSAIIGISLFVFITTICVIPSTITSIILLGRFKKEELRKRWKYFTIGEIGMFTIYYIFILEYTIYEIDPIIRLIITMYLIPSYLLWGYFLYQGIARTI